MDPIGVVPQSTPDANKVKREPVRPATHLSKTKTRKLQIAFDSQPTLSNMQFSILLFLGCPFYLLVDVLGGADCINAGQLYILGD